MAKLKKLLIKFLAIGSCIALMIAMGLFISWFRNRHIKQGEHKVQGVACVIHKVNPVQLPQSFLVLFVTPNGGEFYTESQGVYESVEDGDCIKYVYTELIEYDETKGDIRSGVVIGFNYEFMMIEKHKKSKKDDLRNIKDPVV